MTDWIFMTKNTSRMFITGPDVVRTVTGEQIDAEELGGAVTHNTKSGVAHFACESDEDSIEQIKKLLSYLPSSNLEKPPVVETGDDPARMDEKLDTIVPENPRKAYDMRKVIQSLVDNGEIPGTPGNIMPAIIIVMLCPLGGRPLHHAKQPKVWRLVLGRDASDKATRFKYGSCDAFKSPPVNHCRCSRLPSRSNQEWQGIIRHGQSCSGVISEQRFPR
jgi:acetyl-CoA carboxylase carboxyltransferase component